MKKVTLDVDSLHVETFAVQNQDATQRGTVKGHNMKPNPTDWGNTCSGCSREDLPCCTWPYCTETC
ncbi:MAG TPA: hypothetical protein VFJ82_27205 [Longimicrobium sp.]|nr:hypothetical protein [Longimicrobium sp.]